MKYYSMPTAYSTAQAIILANGEFPSHSIPKAILYNNQNTLICCDGAADHLLEQNIIPQTIIGDCDSLSPQNQIQYQTIIRNVPDQTTNDLTKAVLFCKSQSIHSLIILGATGKREDHTIANISLLIRYLSIVDEVTMVTNSGVFNAIQQPSKFQSHPGQQVSLFSVLPTPITTTNLKYALDQQSFAYWWEGTLNESLNDDFLIDVEKPLIIYRTFEEFSH